MIIRVSARFQHCHPGIALKRNLPPRPFPLTWDVDLLIHGRSQYLVIASEEYSLYSLLFPVGRSERIDSFLIPFSKRVAQLGGDISSQPPRAADMVFSNRVNRHVIGSQNDLLFITHELLKEVDKSISPELVGRIEQMLNATPMSYLEMNNPADAFAKRMRE